MKHKFVIGLLLFVIFEARAQDRIITLQKDTIDCRIVSIENGRIYYEQPAGNGSFTGSSLAMEQVTVYFRVAPAATYENRVLERNTPPEKRWRFGLQGGPGYMLANSVDAENAMTLMGSSAETAQKFYKNLKWGYHIDTDVHNLITESFGIGIRYSLFATAANEPVTINIGDGLNYWYMNMEERIYVNYIGLSLLFRENRLNRSRTLRSNLSLSVGYVSYRDELEFQRNSFMQLDNGLTTGNSIGGVVEVSLEYFPVSWLSIAANAGCFASWIGGRKISNGYESQIVSPSSLGKGEWENVSRFDLSIGVRFYVK